MRDFKTIYDAIHNLLSAELAQKLDDQSSYWAPEICWHNLSVFVNKYVQKDSKDNNSVRIYATLCDDTVSGMRARFIRDGY